MQALKSLRCWLYQCSEGNVPEQPLFKALERYAGDLAFHIVAELPGWNAAEWG